MPTPESERVQKQRRENFDRLSVLIEKGGRYLVNALAVREGISKAALIRQSILARAGLRVLPYPPELDKLKGITSEEEAEKAILRLQNQEEGSEIISNLIEEISPEGNRKEFEIEASYDLKRVLKKITDAESGESVNLSGYEIGIIRRALSNLKVKPQHID